MGCDEYNHPVIRLCVISIHAPIVGCDAVHCRLLHSIYVNFNPRTHRGVRLFGRPDSPIAIVFQSTHPSWGATISSISTQSANKFQSTHPSWGATLFFRTYSVCADDFNPRTHRGVRLYETSYTSEKNLISIHAPIVGCDTEIAKSLRALALFQSTHPSWGATKGRNGRPRRNVISIHAPIVGCDCRVILQ